jgi:hypothetical protein
VAEIKVHYDKGTQSLTIWFGNPEDEVICEHTDSDVVVMEAEDGRPLGIEVITFKPWDNEPLSVSLHVYDTSKSREPARVP